MGGYDAASEADRGRDDERVDRHLAACVDRREEVAGDSSRSSARRHHLSEAPCENSVNRLVDSTAPVQLDEHRRRNPYGRVPSVRAPHRGPNALMSLRVLSWTGERRDRFAIQD